MDRTSTLTLRCANCNLELEVHRNRVLHPKNEGCWGQETVRLPGVPTDSLVDVTIERAVQWLGRSSGDITWSKLYSYTFLWVKDSWQALSQLNGDPRPVTDAIAADISFKIQREAELAPNALVIKP